VKQARPYLRSALKGDPGRPMCLALTIASYTPAPLRALFAPLGRKFAASRYASWR